jgi:hypothetical protein
MDLSQVLLEGRKEDFLRKFRNKFNEEQIKELFLLSRGLSPNQKYLIFLGDVINPENFKSDLEKSKTAIEKFIKYQEVLDEKDINQYKSLKDIIDAINTHENKVRRTVENREDADVVYEDDRFTVLTPRTYKSSCYYGAGTKWCTAASNGSSHFDTYNVDGKLFYFIDKKAKSSDDYYKVALLQKYDGEKSYWDVKDSKFNTGWILNTPTYDEIQLAIDEYLQSTYEREIEIFKDKERAKLERERIRKQQEAQRVARILADAEERKEADEWNLESYDDQEARKANAVFKVIQDDYGVDVDEENGESIYNLVPTQYNHYGLPTFEWLGEDSTGTHWAVGDWDEVFEAAKEYQQNIWDDMGVEGWNRDFIMNYIDEDQVRDYFREVFDYDVRDNPEVYFDSEDLPLSNSQEKEIEKLEEEMEEMEEIVHHDNSTEEEVDVANERIEEIMDEIDEIKSNPEGEPDEDMIEDAIENRVNEQMHDMIGSMRDFGMDLKDYIDVDQLISDTIDADGAGNTIGTYDGSENEVLIKGTWYYVYRAE